MEATSIREWNTSLYTINKRWISGVIKLLPSSLLFCQHATSDTQKNATEYKLELPFHIISGINKSFSSYIFPAIIILTSRKEKHWFSSFISRDDTLIILEHFFHFYLVKVKNPDHNSPQEDITQCSSIGKEFLRTVVDSKQHLTNAGNRLVEQGEQLRRSSSKMVDVHNDVTVATKLTQGIKSWLPKWRIPKIYESEEFCVLKKNEVPIFFSCNALCCNVFPNVTWLHAQCIVTIAKEAVSVFDNYQKILQHFKWSDISEVKMVSLWEITISQHHIGMPDRKCNIISVDMLSLLRELDKFLSNRMKCINPEIESAWTSLKNQQSVIGTRKSSESTLSSHNEEGNALDTAHYIPTDQEMRSLTNELTGLKSLALEIQKVEDKQLKDIDELTGAVTRENDRLSKLNKTLKRL